MLIIDHERCTACKLCLRVCPFGALSFEGGLLTCSESCTLCGACVSICNFKALTIERIKASPEELAAYRGVYIWVELEENQAGSKTKKVALELLGKGRALADRLGEELAAVVLVGHDSADVSSLGWYGADRVILCQHKLLASYTTDAYTQVMSAVIAAKKPAIVLYGATAHGRDLAPRIAARLRLGLTADCTGLDIDDQNQLVQTRPAFGGNIMASIVTPATRPQTATVRPNVFNPPLPIKDRQALLEPFPVALNRAAIRTRVVERDYLDQAGAVNLEDARVIVSGGRGCQKASNLEMLRQLAGELGGAVAGSRAVVEQGWLPHTQQVGQSGSTVAPELYIAAGISGAVQHTVGMSASKVIIAINKDPEAPILKMSDLGIVGDALEILPILTRLIRQDKQKDTDTP